MHARFNCRMPGRNSLISLTVPFGLIVLAATELVPHPVLQALDRAGTRVYCWRQNSPSK